MLELSKQASPSFFPQMFVSELRVRALFVSDFEVQFAG
jgi:hypothetical protein